MSTTSWLTHIKMSWFVTGTHRGLASVAYEHSGLKGAALHYYSTYRYSCCARCVSSECSLSYFKSLTKKTPRKTENQANSNQKTTKLGILKQPFHDYSPPEHETVDETEINKTPPLWESPFCVSKCFLFLFSFLFFGFMRHCGSLLLARAAVLCRNRSKWESECHCFQRHGIDIIAMLFHNKVLFYGVRGRYIQEYR